MNKKIIYTKENGGLVVITPDFSTKRRSETWNDFYDRIKKKDVPFGVKASIVAEREIPTDREYRNFWKMDLYDKLGSIEERAPRK